MKHVQHDNALCRTCTLQGEMWHAICLSTFCDTTTDGIAQQTDQQMPADTTPTSVRDCGKGGGGYADTRQLLQAAAG